MALSTDQRSLARQKYLDGLSRVQELEKNYDPVATRRAQAIASDPIAQRYEARGAASQGSGPKGPTVVRGQRGMSMSSDAILRRLAESQGVTVDELNRQSSDNERNRRQLSWARGAGLREQRAAKQRSEWQRARRTLAARPVRRGFLSKSNAQLQEDQNQLMKDFWDKQRKGSLADQEIRGQRVRDQLLWDAGVRQQRRGRQQRPRPGAGQYDLGNDIATLGGQGTGAIQQRPGGRQQRPGAIQRRPGAIQQRPRPGAGQYDLGNDIATLGGQPQSGGQLGGRRWARNNQPQSGGQQQYDLGNDMATLGGQPQSGGQQRTGIQRPGAGQYDLGNDIATLGGQPQSGGQQRTGGIISPALIGKAPTVQGKDMMGISQPRSGRVEIFNSRIGPSDPPPTLTQPPLRQPRSHGVGTGRRSKPGARNPYPSW